MKLQTHLPASKINRTGQSAQCYYTDPAIWQGVIMVEPPKIVVNKPMPTWLLAFLKRLRYAA